MSLSKMEAKLPPGFRFHPRDDELVCDYLMGKVFGNETENLMMIEVNLNKCEPWQLPDTARVGSKEWYFFSLHDRKYASGLRTNRATLCGYWKATGKDKQVIDVRRGLLVGMRKTLVFYVGRAPKGRKTDWVMHEFRLEGPSRSPKISSKEDWVLCRVFCKNRGIEAQPIENDDPSSSSLPPLLDPIAFDQNPINLGEFEPVTCFSNYSQSTNPTFSDFPQMETNMPSMSLAQLGGLPDLGSLLNPLSCDKKVMKAVLDHLIKFDSNPKLEASPSLAEGSAGSYLSEVGLSSMWNQC